MITDTDEHIKETTLDSKRLSHDLLFKIGFENARVGECEEQKDGEHIFISPDKRICIAQRLQDPSESLWVIFENDNRDLTALCAYTYGDLRICINFLKRFWKIETCISL